MTATLGQVPPSGKSALQKLAIATGHSPEKVQHDSVCVTPTTSKSNAVRGLSRVEQDQEAAPVSDDSVFRSSNWMISVSSVMGEGSEAAAVESGVQERFVIVVSEPDREYTLFRNRDDFIQLHEAILANGTTPPRLPRAFVVEKATTHASLAPQTLAPDSASPSKKPKKRPSFFLAKVKSIFQDAQPAKTPTPSSQPRPALHQKVSTSEPPISPPHSPAGDPSVKPNAFAFETGGNGCPTASMMYGAREDVSSLTPSNSSTLDVQGARSQRLSHKSTTDAHADGHSINPASSSGVSKSGAVQASEYAYPGHLAPPSLPPSRMTQRRSLDPIIIPPTDVHKIPSPQALPSNGLDALEFNRTDVALADYLIALCSQPTTKERDILRLFFRVRRPGPSLSISTAASSAQPAGPITSSATENGNAQIALKADEPRLPGTDVADVNVAAEGDEQAWRRYREDGQACGRQEIVPDSAAPTMSGDLCPRRNSEPSTSNTCQEVHSASAQASPTPRGSVALQEHDSTGQQEASRQPRKVTIDVFDLIRTLGKGCAGKVVLARHTHSRKVFAVKAMGKKQVVAQSELDHALIEQAVLRRMSSGNEEERNPFVVKLWWSFHDEHNLYLVLDFHPGGDLATQLSRWGRLGRDRARFYTAEIVEGVEGLHAAGVIYRDLKPENVLLGQDGHVVLVDFGLAADFYPNHRSPGCVLPHWMATDSAASAEPANRPPLHRHITDALANTERDYAKSFVGTAEYLAPEVIRGLPYSYEVDWFSLGTMLFEALVGHTPFWANNHSEMYMNVLHDELRFPEDSALDRDTKSFIRGLLCKDPEFRLKEPRIKKHPYLSIVDFDHVRHRRYIPPYIPPTDTSLEFDTSNFDKTFLCMDTSLKRESVPPDVLSGSSGDTPFPNESAFAAYDFVDEEFGCVQYNDDVSPQGPESIARVHRTSTKRSDRESTDGECESDSLSASSSISSLGSQDGLGAPAMRDIPEEREGDVSTETAAAQQHILDERAYLQDDRASREISAAMKRRIQTLASNPAIKSSSRHSRDATRTSADLTGEDGADEWTMLDAKPEDQALNGRTVKRPMSARGVVDRYRLALNKRRAAPRKKPSWRSPSSSLIFGKAGASNAKGNDGDKSSSGFLTPLSPTLADFKIRLKNRNGKKKAAVKKSSTPGGNEPAPASANESSGESGILYSGGATPARYGSSKSVSSREHPEGK